jgi:hypothetical protein
MYIYMIYIYLSTYMNMYIYIYILHIYTCSFWALPSPSRRTMHLLKTQVQTWSVGSRVTFKHTFKRMFFFDPHGVLFALNLVFYAQKTCLVALLVVFFLCSKTRTCLFFLRSTTLLLRPGCLYLCPKAWFPLVMTACSHKQPPKANWYMYIFLFGSSGEMKKKAAATWAFIHHRQNECHSLQLECSTFAVISIFLRFPLCFFCPFFLWSLLLSQGKMLIV